MFRRLLDEWKTEGPEFSDAADLLRVLECTQFISTNRLEEMKDVIQYTVLSAACKGCRSDELRELICVIDTSDSDNQAIDALRSAFDQYCQSLFSDELRECRSREKFRELAEDLEFIREELSVDVSPLLEEIEEQREEFEEGEEAYADHMQDEWKERWRDERANERAVTQMFRSLR